MNELVFCCDKASMCWTSASLAKVNSRCAVKTDSHWVETVIIRTLIGHSQF